MADNFWAERWRQGQIGFHEGRTNAFLQRHVKLLGPHRRVLVPLCGKTEDLVYLASLGHEVIGVELVQEAVDAFFAEHAIQPELIRRGAFARYSADKLTLLVGDFFALGAEDVGAVNALYDRAAIVALPPELRGPYVQKLRALLPKGSPGIIVTLEYPGTEKDGPPFSVPEAELRAHYEGCDVQLLEETAWTSRGRSGLAGRECAFSVRF